MKMNNKGKFSQLYMVSEIRPQSGHIQQVPHLPFLYAKNRAVSFLQAQQSSKASFLSLRIWMNQKYSYPIPVHSGDNYHSKT